MVDTRIEYIKSIGFIRDKNGTGWDRYRRVVGHQVTYIGHDKTTDEFKISTQGKFKSIFENNKTYEEYKLFRRKYIINKLLDDRA
jgi:hypothetical protein